VPTYAYACTACEHRFEIVQSFTEDSLTQCPQCQGRLRKLFNAVGVVFKGSGFYRNDSRNDSRRSSGSGSRRSSHHGSDSTSAPASSSESGSSSSDSTSSRPDSPSTATTTTATKSVPKSEGSAA
jgi:putative FmdB family regulatory protein